MALPLPPPDGAHRQGRPARQRRTPDYRRRRIVAAGVALLAVVGVVAAVVTLTRDSDDGGTAAAGADWDVVVVIGSGGRLDVFDEAGEAVDELTGLSVGAAPAVAVPGPSSLVVGDDAGGVAYVDLADVRVEQLTVDEGSVLARVATSPATVSAAPPRVGGNVVLVDLSDRDVIDVGTIAGLEDPLLLADTILADRSGDRYLIADAANFQTLMVGGGLDEPRYFPGRPLGVAGDVVVTGQPAGDRVDIGLFDLAGERLASGSAERLVGGTVDQESFVFVTATGAVARIAAGDDAVREIARVSLPSGTEVATARPALAGSRLVVGNDRFTAVVDTEGREVARYEGSGFDTPVVARSSQRCIVIGARSSADAEVHLVDLETGEELGTAGGGEGPVATPDGCTIVAPSGDGAYRVVGRDTDVALGADVEVVDALAPDGEWVAVTTGGGRELRAVPTGDEEDDGDSEGDGEGGGDENGPIELPAAGVVVFVDR